MPQTLTKRILSIFSITSSHFFRSLKTERVSTRQYKTRQEPIEEIADYIEPFYNRIRRHSTLGNLSPAAYVQKYQQTSWLTSYFVRPLQLSASFQLPSCRKPVWICLIDQLS